MEGDGGTGGDRIGRGRVGVGHRAPFLSYPFYAASVRLYCTPVQVLIAGDCKTVWVLGTLRLNWLLDFDTLLSTLKLYRVPGTV